MAGLSEDEPNVPEDLRFQRRNWRVQRLSWVLMAAVLAASMFGALGRGPLAAAVATSADGTLRADYERIVRRFSATSIHVSTATNPRDGGTLNVRVSRRFLDGVELQRIAPQPVKVAAAGDYLACQFALSGTGRETRVVFEFMPREMGRQQIEVAVQGGERLRFTQFVLP